MPVAPLSFQKRLDEVNRQSCSLRNSLSRSTEIMGSEGRKFVVRHEHLTFLESNKAKLLACGAKLDDLGASASGGIYILDTEDRQEAESFIADDPFTKTGLFERVEISRWRKAYFNFVNCLPRPKDGTLIELES
jgi:uncharacterized protein